MFSVTRLIATCKAADQIGGRCKQGYMLSSRINHRLSAFSVPCLIVYYFYTDSSLAGAKDVASCPTRYFSSRASALYIAIREGKHGFHILLIIPVPEMCATQGLETWQHSRKEGTSTLELLNTQVREHTGNGELVSCAIDHHTERPQDR
jgi:hypothetical protein